MSTNPTDIISITQQTRRNRIAIGMLVTLETTLLTIMNILLVESDKISGIKTTEEGLKFVWCIENIPVYLDEDSASDEDELQDIIDIYQPYTPVLIYMGTVPVGTRLPYSIQIHQSLVPSYGGDDWGAEETMWDPITGCIYRSDIFTYPDTTGFDRYMILCHEFGHAISLEHSNDPWSPMYSPPGGMTCTLDKKAKNALSNVYLEQQ